MVLLIVNVNTGKYAWSMWAVQCAFICKHKVEVGKLFNARETFKMSQFYKASSIFFALLTNIAIIIIEDNTYIAIKNSCQLTPSSKIKLFYFTSKSERRVLLLYVVKL